MLGERDVSKVVRYLQTGAGGHAFDLRIPSSFDFPEEITGIDDCSQEQLQALAEAVECFAGVSKAHEEASEWTISWHGAFLFPPALGDASEPTTVLKSISADAHVTEDRGRAVPVLPRGRSEAVKSWIETHPDGDYEEEWLRLEGFQERGAHVAAMRPALPGERGTCWLAILGSTFAFVRDIDRSQIPPEALNRTVAEMLVDSTISLESKRRIMDCDFSFGTFGQGGGVGGVVEWSSHPWQRGTALATFLGDADASEWEPVRATDRRMLDEALRAVREDHSKACVALREALSNGQTEIADVLKARGAVCPRAAAVTAAAE